MKNIVEIMKERGFFEDMTSPELVEKTRAPITVYAGFDSSSDSLQVGNYVTIMVLAHFQRCGHKVIALVGGACRAKNGVRANARVARNARRGKIARNSPIAIE